MIVYGTKATLVKTELVHEQCPNCKSNYSVQMNIFQRYAHVFWIPFFPIGKTGVSACGKCQQVLKLNNMPESLKAGYDNLKTQTGTPLWTFSGLAIVAVIVIAVSINDGRETKARNQYVLSPKKGDVLQVKIDSGYTLFKITEVDKDSIRFVMDKYLTNEETDVSNLAAKGYDTAGYIMARSRLVQMNNEDKILGIDR